MQKHSLSAKKKKKKKKNPKTPLIPTLTAFQTPSQPRHTNPHPTPSPPQPFTQLRTEIAQHRRILSAAAEPESNPSQPYPLRSKQTALPNPSPNPVACPTRAKSPANPTAQPFAEPRRLPNSSQIASQPHCPTLRRTPRHSPPAQPVATPSLDSPSPTTNRVAGNVKGETHHLCAGPKTPVTGAHSADDPNPARPQTPSRPEYPMTQTPSQLKTLATSNLCATNTAQPSPTLTTYSGKPPHQRDSGTEIESRKSETKRERGTETDCGKREGERI